MDQVAIDLGISKKTLYEMYRDKAGLIWEVLNFRLHECKHTPPENINAIEFLMHIRKTIILCIQEMPAMIIQDLHRYYPGILQNYMRQKRMHILSAMRVNIEEGIVQGLFRKDINPDLVARLYILMVEAVLEQRGHEDFQKLNELITYHVHAISTQKGIDFYHNHVMPKLKTDE